jgi:hypothetical protein
MFDCLKVPASMADPVAELQLPWHLNIPGSELLDFNEKCIELPPVELGQRGCCRVGETGGEPRTMYFAPPVLLLLLQQLLLAPSLQVASRLGSLQLVRSLLSPRPGLDVLLLLFMPAAVPMEPAGRTHQGMRFCFERHWQ